MNDNPARVVRAIAEQIVPPAFRSPGWDQRWEAAIAECDEPVPAYRPGDVHPDGSIERVPPGPGLGAPPLTKGTIWVTFDQAERAAAHGWRSIGPPLNGLVKVTR